MNVYRIFDSKLFSKIPNYVLVIQIVWLVSNNFSHNSSLKMRPVYVAFLRWQWKPYTFCGIMISQLVRVSKRRKNVRIVRHEMTLALLWLFCIHIINTSCLLLLPWQTTLRKTADSWCADKLYIVQSIYEICRGLFCATLVYCHNFTSDVDYWSIVACW